MPCPTVPSVSELHRQRGDFNAKVAKGHAKSRDGHDDSYFQMKTIELAGARSAPNSFFEAFGIEFEGGAVATFAHPLRPLR